MHQSRGTGHDGLPILGVAPMRLFEKELKSRKDRRRLALLL